MPSDHAHSAAEHGEEGALAELLDLDGDVLHAFWQDLLARVRAAAGPQVAHVLDLGAGTGTGTIGLANAFPGARVTAVDASEQMLQHIRAKAGALGVAGRVRTVHADLDDAWPVSEPVELILASMSLHHLGDPDRLLARAFASTRPGGLLAVVEMADQLRFLPDDLGFGRPGLEQRCLDALSAEHAAALPHLGSDWSARASAAGFTDLAEHAVPIDVRTPKSPAARRYAYLWLSRLRTGLADRLASDDAAALAELLDGSGSTSLARRDDLHIRGTRTLTLARRPG